MASDINTKSTNAQTTTQLGTRSSFDRLMDLYWGGSERRITGFTLRIIGINALSILVLMIGVLNFGQYETRMITEKLKSFNTEVNLTVQHVIYDMRTRNEISPIFKSILRNIGEELILFDENKDLFLSTHQPETLIKRMITPIRHGNFVTSDDLIKSAIDLTPNRSPLPIFPQNADGSPNYKKALNDQSTIQVWSLSPLTNDILLTATVDFYINDQQYTVLIIRSGRDIVDSVYYFWQQLLNIFIITFFMTVIISIYLSGTISRPLRKLARAAETVRRKNTRSVTIPDFSRRYDEIGELSLVMRDMTESLWKRVDSIESFAADVAHELKNPLTSLKSAIETLQITKKQSDKEKLFNILQHDIERMDRLITDISKASRLDAELSREKQSLINIAPIINQIIDRYQAHYKSEYNISLIMSHDRPIVTEGLEIRLTQVLSNILDNAISFSPEKGRITVSVLTKGHQIIIHIDDEGPGIAPNKIDHIFERFYSERRQDGKFGNHSGLGLSICRQIIDSMGGQITAENKQNKAGARFSIILDMTRSD